MKLKILNVQKYRKEVHQPGSENKGGKNWKKM